MKTFSLLNLALALTLLPVSMRAEEAYRPEIKAVPLLKTDKDAAGRTIVYPRSGPAELTAVMVEIPVGAKTGWHEHPLPCMAYLLEGELQVQLANGKIKKIKAGEAFAEVVDLLHSGENRGRKPVKLILFVAGVKGQPYAIKKKP